MISKTLRLASRSTSSSSSSLSCFSIITPLVFTTSRFCSLSSSSNNNTNHNNVIVPPKKKHQMEGKENLNNTISTHHDGKKSDKRIIDPDNSSESLIDINEKLLDMCDRASRKMSEISTNASFRNEFVAQFQKSIYDINSLWEEVDGGSGKKTHQRQTNNLLRLPSPLTLDIVLSICYESNYLKRDLSRSVPEMFFTPSPQFMNYLLKMKRADDEFLLSSFSSETLVVLAEILSRAHERTMIEKSYYQDTIDLVNEMLKIVLSRTIQDNKNNNEGSRHLDTMKSKITILLRTAQASSRIVAVVGPVDDSSNILKKSIREIELSLQRQSIVVSPESSSSASSVKKFKLPSRYALQLFVLISRAKLKHFPDFTRKVCEASIPCMKYEKDISFLIDAMKGCINIWNFHQHFYSALMEAITERVPDFNSKQLYEVCLSLNLISRRDSVSREYADMRPFAPVLRKLSAALEKRAQEVNLSPRQAKVVVVALTKSGAKLTRGVLESTV